MRPASFSLSGSLRVPVVAACLALALLAGCDSDQTTAPVPAPPLSKVVVSPDADTLQVSQTRQFIAQAYDTLNAIISAPFTWTSSNTAVFTVNTSGIVTARAEGAADLVVSSGGKSDTAKVFVYPDTGWVLQPAGGSNLNGVFFLPDGRTGWAVGDGGRIVATTDAGATWNTQIGFTSNNLNAVWFTSASEGWAVGDANTLLKYTNGTWARITVSIGVPLNDVCFATPDTGWIAGDNGTIARTVNGGDTWIKTNLPSSFAFHSIAFAGTKDGWAVGDGGTVAGTHDRGLTWFITPSLTAQPLKAVWRLDAATAIAVGATGTVLRTVTTPDSVAWQLVVPSAGAANQLEGVWGVGPTLVYAVGYNAGLGGTILRSDDGGATWETQASRTSNRLNDVHFVDAQRGWAVGDGGVIVHTARGGRQ
jgi:photosystem II stability/assembly factor-like uncharacterized protein